MKNLQPLAFYFFILIFISIFLSIPALSAENPFIAMQNLTIKAGDIAGMPVTIQGAQNMSAVTFMFTYDPQVISVESIDAGDFGEPVNNTENGVVIFGISGSSGIDKGILATLNIKGKNAGITVLEFTEPTLYKEDGSTLNISTTGGIITVEGQAEAAASPTGQKKPVEPAATPLKQDMQQEKAVKTPALSWIFVAAIILAAAVIRRRV